MENFEHLSYCENHYSNRWYYLAFSIIYDTEFFGVYSNYSNYDDTLDNDVVGDLADFLCGLSINTLSAVMENKCRIVEFLVSYESLSSGEEMD